MAQRLRSIKGRAIVNLSDHSDIRCVFEGFHIETVPIQCTVGDGRGVERNELIIVSWDDVAQPVGLFQPMVPARTFAPASCLQVSESGQKVLIDEPNLDTVGNLDVFGVVH